jgi:hypothetical protein
LNPDYLQSCLHSTKMKPDPHWRQAFWWLYYQIDPTSLLGKFYVCHLHAHLMWMLCRFNLAFLVSCKMYDTIYNYKILIFVICCCFRSDQVYTMPGTMKLQATFPIMSPPVRRKMSPPTHQRYSIEYPLCLFPYCGENAWSTLKDLQSRPT